jgi:hypothetical protein
LEGRFRGDAHHPHVREVNQHDGIAVLPPTRNVQTDGSHGLGATTLDEIKPYSELEDLTGGL